MKIGGGESERQKGKEIRPSIPARRQIATDAPIIWWKKWTSLLEGATRYIAYHWLNYEKGADSTIVTSRAARFRNTMMKLIVNHDPVELAYRSRHIWTWRSVAEYSSGQKRGSDWCCAVLDVNGLNGEKSFFNGKNCGSNKKARTMKKTHTDFEERQEANKTKKHLRIMREAETLCESE
ncbi:hypothetical protein T09_1203 [Trichinella sp. T9]|nr:hypothetical protein T09_1203 [Trichinella sp. T9]